LYYSTHPVFPKTGYFFAFECVNCVERDNYSDKKKPSAQEGSLGEKDVI